MMVDDCSACRDWCCTSSRNRPSAGPWRLGRWRLVLVVDPWSKPGIRPETVVEALNLTPAQSRVTVLLARGYTLRDIAAATGRSETTVASHLKAIYRKLGISRRAELAQLVHPLTELSLSEP